MLSLGLGWRPDLPDVRDLTPEHESVRTVLNALPQARSERDLSTDVDLTEFFPEVTDQGPWNASSSHACLGLFEYFQRRAFGDSRKYSAPFVYKVTRRMLPGAGDCGADLRTTLKAISRFGAPPVEFAPYGHDDNTEPDAFQYGFARDFHNMRYVRLDARSRTGTDTLERVKALLEAGFPSVFGFVVPRTVSDDACISFPMGGETA